MPKFLLYFSALMSIVYIYFGFYIAFSQSVSEVIQYPFNIFLGVVLVGYGAFRVFRFYQLLVKQKND